MSCRLMRVFSKSQMNGTFVFVRVRMLRHALQNSEFSESTAYVYYDKFGLNMSVENWDLRKYFEYAE